MPPTRRMMTVQPGQPPKEVEPVSVQSAQENWNEYLLSDGSIVRTKTVLMEVYRIVGEYDAEGNPSYLLKNSGVLVVNAPDNLRKPQQ